MKRPPKIAFDKAMDQIDNMKAIHSYLETSAKNLDASAILRAQLLLAVSAVDTYLHAAVSDVLHQKFFQGQGGLLEKSRIRLDFGCQLFHAKSLQEQEEIFDIAIKEAQSQKAYQAPRLIEEAMSLLGVKHLWSRIAKKENKKAKDIWDQMSVIIFRRNQIAHESDFDFVTMQLRPANAREFGEAVDFLRRFVDDVDALIYGEDDGSA